MGQVAFLLFSLLRQNVTFVSVLTLDFTGSGKRETLFSTGVRFYLWHFVINCLIVNTTSDRQPGAHGAEVKVGLRTVVYLSSLTTRRLIIDYRMTRNTSVIPSIRFSLDCVSLV